MKPSVGIIIVDYQNEVETKACLNSLSRLDKKFEYRVFVVLPETETSTLAKHETELRLITSRENLGYAWAVNLGIKQAAEAECKYVIVMNNDVTVKSDFVEPLVNTLNNPEVGLVSPKIYFSPGREFHDDAYQENERGKVIWYAGGVIDWENIYAWHWGVNEVDHGQFEKVVETDFATGCCVAFKADLIDKIGLWDERYFLYLEDTDWSVRVKKAGLKIMFEPKSVIWHKNAGSTGGPGSRIHQYYQTRNRVLFASKFASIKTKALIHKQALGAAISGEGVVKRANKDALLKKWGKSHL